MLHLSHIFPFLKLQMKMCFCDTRVENMRPANLETGGYLALLISEQDGVCKLLRVP